MIQIAGTVISPDTTDFSFPANSIEGKIIGILSSSSGLYSYRSASELEFELNLRKSIIKAARELNKTYFSFRTFRKSICNPDFWERTDEGGFLLKEGVKPSDAILDIYENSRKYGTECATAMVIVFYKALTEVFPKELFDRTFTEIYLMDWQHLDPQLGITNYRDVKDFLPGDCRYFANPDVDPLTPQWQGENTIDLGDGTFYGHGPGIATADQMIAILNKFRREGAETSAYLMDSATRPNFKYLAYKAAAL